MCEAVTCAPGVSFANATTSSSQVGRGGIFFGVLGIAGAGDLEGVRLEGRKLLVGALVNLSVSHPGLQLLRWGCTLK
jgi:hypothetical protein